jgi:hypothetical protein
MFVNGLGAPITLDTDNMMLPVLIPRAAEPAVTGWNSMWLMAGAGILGAAVFKPGKTAAKTAQKKIKIGK